MLDQGQQRILALVLELRRPGFSATPLKTAAVGSDQWFAVAHESLAAELIEFGINDVVVNRYGVALEDVIDTLSELRRVPS